MAQIEWAHICRYAFLDEHQKACLISVHEQGASSKYPFHTRLYLAGSVLLDPGETVTANFMVADPDGAPAVVSFINCNICNEKDVPLRTGFAASFTIQFNRPGLHSLEIIFDGIVVRTLHYDLWVTKPDGHHTLLS